MLEVSLDGQKLKLLTKFSLLSDIIEEVRQFVPLQSVIVRIKINGEEIREESWEVEISHQADLIIEVETADKYNYLSHRMQLAASYLTQISAEFSQASSDFSNDSSSLGNTALATAIDNFLAFVHWYLALLALDRPVLGDVLDQFRGHVVSIQQVCEQMLAQQIFENNWLVGEILRNKLVPELERLHLYCQDVSRGYLKNFTSSPE